MVESKQVCPKCGAVMEFRLGQLECPGCFHVMEPNIKAVAEKKEEIAELHRWGATTISQKEEDRLDKVDRIRKGRLKHKDDVWSGTR